MPTVNHSTTISVISRHQADSRGLTLFELLIALAVVLAIGALALPFTFREYERRESVAVRDHIAMQALMARAQARVGGVPYAMVLDEAGRHIEVREIDPRDPGDVFMSDEGDEEFEASREEEDSSPLESWQLVVLPEGTHFELDQPRRGSEEPSSEFAQWEPEEEDEDVPLVGVRLAVFMPDGTLLGARPLILRGPAGRFRLEFDPWTGSLATTFIPMDTESGT